jgi:hypothetical protein
VAGWQVHSVDISCNISITPECAFNLYKIHYKGDARNGNTAAIGSFLEIYTIYEDLVQFEEKYAPYAKGENVCFHFPRISLSYFELYTDL